MDDDLIPLLRTHWGYDAFRPRQEAIVRSLLDGQDVAVVMPTGGGKSLCYQLPAVVSGRTAVVISPLISLMQDQVAQLAQMGIPAALLNSTLNAEQQRATMKAAIEGQFRLLYLSPERLARQDTVAWLRRAPIAFFAIDEAHCISEWGHEFRPEYRQLNRLRADFPSSPIAAFTASATRRVRHDILAQLQLREPRTFIMSFFRSNLRYSARECKGSEQERLLIAALRRHDGDNAIVYAPTIARVEEVADMLCGIGIEAVPYHGKMDAAERRRNQERWMSDEVRVLVGTIAFGLGINKPNVRAVVHLSLPKSIEQYYQEAGRAGRDGLPADCVLLWRKQDTALLAHFIKEVSDPAERERSWGRYHEIKRFVDLGRCRHLQICNHFGETPKWAKCDACDVCLGDPDWFRARVPAAKGKAVKKRTEARQPAAAVPGPDSLLEYLREWRRNLANELGMPAYVVLHDASLIDFCERRPRDPASLLAVHGIGRRKAESIGPRLLEALASFERGARAAPVERKAPPSEEIPRLLAEGRSFAEIAKIRGRQVDTIISYAADMVERGKIAYDPRWVEESVRLAVEAAARRLGTERLRPIKEALPESVGYPEIRLVAASLRRQDTGSPAQGNRE